MATTTNSTVSGPVALHLTPEQAALVVPLLQTLTASAGIDTSARDESKAAAHAAARSEIHDSGIVSKETEEFEVYSSSDVSSRKLIIILPVSMFNNDLCGVLITF